MSDNIISSNYSSQLAALKLAQADKQQAASSSASGFASLVQNVVNAVSGRPSGNNLDDIFKRAAAQYNVPENLLKAVAKAESGYDAHAVSSCGAQGVMQLMPSTASSLGVNDPFDAEQNIMGGAKYLSQMLARYDGNAKLALAAYNAGSGNVAKYGGVPPFKETQTYVTRVMNYAGMDSSALSDQLSSINTGNSSLANPLSSMASLLNNASSSDKLSALAYLMGSSSDSESPFSSLLGTSGDSQLSALSSLMGSSSYGQMASLNALLGSSSSDSSMLSSFGSMLGTSALTGAGDTSGSSSAASTAKNYTSLLQLFIAQMQMNSSQPMSSDLSGVLSSDSSSSSLL